MKKTKRAEAKRHFTDEEKGQILFALELSNWDFNAIAAEFKVTSRTLHNWLNESDRLAEYTEAKRKEFAFRIDNVLNQLLERIIEVIPKTEKLSELATTFGILFDKQALTDNSLKNKDSEGFKERKEPPSREEMEAAIQSTEKTLEEAKAMLARPEGSEASIGENFI